MKSTFRLYNQINSSFFNLIDGKTEVQQTKGLALLLAKSDVFLNEFIYILLNKKLNFDEVIVNAELTKNNFRCDILIRLFFNKEPLHAFLIEAKSVNKGIEAFSVINQIDNYSNNDYSEIKPFRNKISLIILTKYNTISSETSHIFITWNDIVNMLFKVKGSSNEHILNELTKDYLNFLTNIKGTMKFYENEVLSIPTRDNTNLLASSEPYIYECPNDNKYRINSKPLYIAFRKSGGGVMDKLFGIDDIIILNPKNGLEPFINDESYDLDVRNRVKKYCEKINLTEVDEDKQFLILSKTNIIELKHNPKPLKNNSYRAYYQLHDILQNEVVGLK